MDRDTARKQIRSNWRRIIPPDASGKGGICPLCGSGSGPHGTGITENEKVPGQLHCWSCGFAGDVIDLLQAQSQIGYNEALKQAAGVMGIELDPYNSGTAPAGIAVKKEVTATKQVHNSNTENLTPYYAECAARRNASTYLQQRGISEATAAAAGLGYDMHYTESTGGQVWQALIIPTGPASYEARNTDPNAASNQRYRKHGPAQRFMLDSLSSPGGVYIVEGAMDALSIKEAGGQAVGLGSTSGVPEFLKYLEATKIKPAQPLLLCLDADDAGRKAEQALAAGLQKLGIKFLHYNPAEMQGCKDANEALLQNRSAFTAAVVKGNDVEALAREQELAIYQQNNAANHLKDFISGITENANTPATSTGFEKLDAVLDGGLYEGLYIVGAISSLGKTTFALQMCDQIADLTGQDVLIFSLEMARNELISKSISRLTLMETMGNKEYKQNDAKTSRGITAGARYKGYSPAEQKIIRAALEDYKAYAGHIYITEGLGEIGAAAIRQAVDKHIRLTGNKPIVLIDYLQILAPADPRATDKQNTDKSVMELKRISRDYKIPVIGISSLNRANYSTEISMEAYKESGAIEYSSDVLIGLQLEGVGKNSFNVTEAKSRNPRAIELVILKNRNGSVGDKVKYSYYPLFNYFKEEKDKDKQ